MSNNPFRSTQRDEGYVSEGYEGANEDGAAGTTKEMDSGRDGATIRDGGAGPDTFQDLPIHIREEGHTNARPPYTRAPSSHIPPSIAPKSTPQEAHAEAIRRLGKAEHTVKTLRRRGSNESLSSLLSYSLRRPSLSTPSTASSKPASGYSLDALAHVLEDAAQEGNLPLVEALFGLGVNPNFRSVNKIKNRRHNALNNAVAAGHVDVIDYLIRRGATFDGGEGNGRLKGKEKDGFEAIDYKLLDVAYAGFMDVAKYLVVNQGANPLVTSWPREYADARRTVYRRVEATRVLQRTVLDGIARWGHQENDLTLLNTVFGTEGFKPDASAAQIYVDQPYDGDGTRMHQTTHTYSALSLFVRAGWVDAIESLLALNPSPDAYEIQDEIETEEGQIPSTSTFRTIWPVNALTHSTYQTHPDAALRILKLLIEHGFDVETPQQTPDDSAPRSPLARAIRADAKEAVQAMVEYRPQLVNKEIDFRVLVNGEVDKEYVAKPLAAAKLMGSQGCMEVLRGWEKRLEG